MHVQECRVVDESGDECGRPTKAAGLCSKHYARQRRLGSTYLPSPRRRKLTTEDALPVMLANGFMPLVPYPGNARTGWPSLCLDPECGRESAPTYDNVRRRGPCCKWCSKRVVDPDQAASVMVAAGLVPLTPYPGRNSRPWPCRCVTCQTVVTPCLTSVSRGAGCNACGNRRSAESRRLDAAHATSVMTAAGLDPVEPYSGTNRPWRSRCRECGKEVSPSLTRVKNGARCGYCKRNRMDDLDAVQAMLAVGLEPLEPYPGSGRPWLCRCVHCNFARSAYLDNIRQGVGICPSCATYGIDYSAPGYLYVVRSHDTVKCGIANEHRLAARLAAHRAQGLADVVYTRHYSVTQDAKQVEDVWKRYVRSNRSQGEWQVPREELSKGGGHTEALRITPDSVAALQRLLPDLEWTKDDTSLS